MAGLGIVGDCGLAARRALVALVVLASACGGGSDDTAATATGDAAAPKSLAALVIIDRDTSVRPVGVPAFRGGNEGEGLGVGDTIQTSATGFAEIAYFDGSLTRVDRSGEFTLTTLDNTTGARRVEGSLVGGRAWNRVTKATGTNDQFEIDTPVATAAVRGTAFAIDCTPTDACTFTIVEGTVDITPTGATPITVTAPARITIQRNTPPPAPTAIDAATINADPWIVKNTTRDTTTGKTPTTSTSSTSTSSTTTTTLPATTTSTVPPAAPTTAPSPRPTDPPTTEPPAPPTTEPLATGLDLTGSWASDIEDLRVVTSGGLTSATAAIEGDQLVIRFTSTGPNSSGSSRSQAPIGATSIRRSGSGFLSSGRVNHYFVATGSNALSVLTQLGDPINAGKSICPQSQDLPDLGRAEVSEDGRTIRFTTGQATGRGTGCSISFVQVAWTQVLTRTD